MRKLGFSATISMQQSQRIWRCGICRTLTFHLDAKTLKLASVSMRLISAAESRPRTLRSEISTLSWVSDGDTEGVRSIALMPIADKAQGAQYVIIILFFLLWDDLLYWLNSREEQRRVTETALTDSWKRPQVDAAD